MEEENNHEENLICNKLKNDEEEEYNRKFSALNRLIKEDTSKNDEKQIIAERNFIKENKAKCNINEEISLKCTDEAIEKGRSRILKLTIGFLEDNRRSEENIRYLKKLMEAN